MNLLDSYGTLEESKVELPTKLEPVTIMCISFNQDRSWMAVGTSTGFRIYDTKNLTILDRCEGKNFSLKSGVTAISLLSKTILVAMVLDGLNTNYPNNKVVLWDKYTKEVKKEYKHNSQVQGVYLVSKKLITLCEKFVYIWELESGKIDRIIGTTSKYKSFCLNSFKRDNIMLAHINDRNYLTLANLDTKIDTSIKPEVNEIQIMAWSDDAQYLAVVDSTGCYVYVYETSNSKLEYEFIRGKTSSVICCLQFSQCGKFLALISEKLTLHIFKLEEKNKKTYQINNYSLLDSLYSYVPKLLSAPKSFAKYHPNDQIDAKTWEDHIMGKLDGPFLIFKDAETPIKICYLSGNFRQVKLNTEEGGECVEVLELKKDDWFSPLIETNIEKVHEVEDEDGFIIV